MQCSAIGARAMSDGVSIFGIRHHGPGCARSLCAALDALQPDCVLIEGPAGCESLLTHLADEQLRPPVALLSYSVDDPDRAVFHPYAEFSPEWQALTWATRHATRALMDVPAASVGVQRRARSEATEVSSETQARARRSQATVEPYDAPPIRWTGWRTLPLRRWQSWWNLLSKSAATAKSVRGDRAGNDRTAGQRETLSGSTEDTKRCAKPTCA